MYGGPPTGIPSTLIAGVQVSGIGVMINLTSSRVVGNALHPSMAISKVGPVNQYPEYSPVAQSLNDRSELPASGTPAQ